MSAQAVVMHSDKSDAAFVSELRLVVQRYLRAVDAWEAEYSKYYRLPQPGQVSSDLEPLQRQYTEVRRELEQMLPRARRMCLKLGLQEPWYGIMRIELGSKSPQTPQASAIGRSERNRVVECLDHLEEASHDFREPEDSPSPAPNPPPVEHRSIFRRIYDWFF
ncbi:MAG TPA: hypothetical protein VKU01_25215 [Bryobacteraceae bacterium]|nr:hypothetical protein [Bryobacteraceae bacterium]